MTVKEVLKTRARKLAQPAQSVRDASQTLEIVEFRLAGERYAIEHEFVREVIALKELTPLPCTPSFVRGIVNIRGQILPVINIKKFFDLPESGIVDIHMIVVVHWQGMEMGIEADLVTGVRLVPVSEIQQTLPTLTGIRAQYLKGVTNQHVVILDAARILADPKLIVDEQIDSQLPTTRKTL